MSRCTRKDGITRTRGWVLHRLYAPSKVTVGMVFTAPRPMATLATVTAFLTSLVSVNP